MKNPFSLKKIFKSRDIHSQYSHQHSPFIPSAFEAAVLKHIICTNTATSVPNAQYPLLLGIQGPYGYGKTYMVKALCKKYNILLTTLSSSDLSGEMEGDSKKNLQKEYEDMCIKIAKGQTCGALLIDDFHLTIATEDSIGKTVNSNLLASYLMNLCDNPDISNTRVPIILTGNNYMRIYPALVRDGRMDIFTWVPAHEDIAQMVSQIFYSKFNEIEESTILMMLEEFSDMNIAFFEQVAQDLINSNLGQTLNAFKENKGKWSLTELSESVKNSLSSVELSEEHLMETCQKRKENMIYNFEKAEKNEI